MTWPENDPTPRPLAVDVLGSPEPVRRTGRRGVLAAGVVGGGALLVAGSAVAFAVFLSGGGAQPEDVLPSSTLGLVKLDLDPAAGQKVAVYRLAKRFPSLAEDVRDQDAVKDELLSALLDGVEELDYATDVQPWIGDRVGLALVPGPEAPTGLGVLAYTDREKAQAAMEKLQQAEDELFFGFSDKADYLLVGESQQVVDDALAPEQVLAETDGWDEGMDALDGDQIATAWTDLGAVWASLPPEARDEAAQMYGLEADLPLGGLLVAGVHAEDDALELVGKGVDLESPAQVTTIGAGEGSDLVQGLPADTVAALAVTGLGDGIATLFDGAYGEQDPLGIVASAREAGLELPEDLRTLLGTETLVAAFGGEAVALRTRTDDVDAAYEKAQALVTLVTGGADMGPALRRLDDGFAVGSTPEALDAVTGDDGGLGDTESFREAVPEADEAGYVAYVDIQRALEMVGVELGEHAADLQQLQSVGISGASDERSSTFRIRLTVRD